MSATDETTSLELPKQVIYSDIPYGSLDAASRYQNGISTHAALVNATNGGNGKTKTKTKTKTRKHNWIKKGGEITVPVTSPAPSQGQLATTIKAAQTHALARSAATYDSDLKPPDSPPMGVTVSGGRRKKTEKKKKRVRFGFDFSRSRSRRREHTKKDKTRKRMKRKI